jgi:hypothetical protein
MLRPSLPSLSWLLIGIPLLLLLLLYNSWLN